MTFTVRISGAQQTRAAMERLRRRSPAAARRAVNRTIGVARERVIKTVSRMTAIPQRVLGGRKANRRRGIKGAGYVKQVKASKVRSEGALVGLVQGVLFSRLNRKRIGGASIKPGGLGQPFNATMRSGYSSLFQRWPPLTKVSRGATAGTKRKNLPIREVVLLTEPSLSRAILVFMRRVARSVYPEKIWEELRKFIKRG